ncbi:desulfoferrodoxin family protein, partial [Thermoproteota archaeon]
MVCCDELMNVQKENTVEAALEKHVPVVTVSDDGIKVLIGEVPHPMEEKHYIEWIELISGDIAYRQFLSPGDKPEAFFPVKPDKLSVREYCNIHGLWLTET